MIIPLLIKVKVNENDNTMGFLPGRIWPLLTQNPLVAKISPRLDQEAKCPAGGGDNGGYGDGRDDGDAKISPRLDSEAMV